MRIIAAGNGTAGAPAPYMRSAGVPVSAWGDQNPGITLAGLSGGGPHQPSRIPGSTLDDIQKKTCLGRLHHGTARTLARMGKHEQAWAEVETIKKMIEDGGEQGKQYWPAYHYVAGYAKLEAGDAPAALEHLKQANLEDPFHVLLLARAYERVGQKDEARKAYQKIVDSQWAGVERPLAYPEVKRKVQAL